MEDLLNVLQMIIDKYQVSEEDVATIQEALSVLESGMQSEFAYDQPTEEMTEEA